MSLLITQDWDVIRGKEDAYEEFVNRRFIPECNRLGLQSVGGFYVDVGAGPSIISIKSVPNLVALSTALSNPAFVALKGELKRYIVNYSSKVLEPSGLVESGEYEIQQGVWKFNLYYDVNQDARDGYESFLQDEFLGCLHDLDYVEVTQVWNVILGGFSEVLIELTFDDPVDLGRLLGNPGYRGAAYKLSRDYTRNYKSRILRTTERFDAPRWFRL